VGNFEPNKIYELGLRLNSNDGEVLQKYVRISSAIDNVPE
jgi:hypothetical protein